MKKDIEWLKEQIERLSYTPKGLDENNSIISKNWVLYFINKLDEPELTQHQVDKYLHERNLVAVNEMMIHQTGMQDKVVVEKPVIPKFVADYIEEERVKIVDWHTEIPERFFLILGHKLNYTTLADTNIGDWVFGGNEEKLYQALKCGYEVENDPHYYVAFKGEFNLLYVTYVNIYGENGKFNYNSEYDKTHALKFTDKSKAEYLADFLGAIVVKVTN